MTSPEPLPPAVRAFLDAQIFSVAQLEVLLLVHAAHGGARTLDELARESYLPAGSIRPWLDALVGRGLLEETDDGYRFSPRDETLREDLAQVADCYARRRVSVTRHVYATKEDPAQRFADAFRFRKERDDDRR